MPLVWPFGLKSLPSPRDLFVQMTGKLKLREVKVLHTSHAIYPQAMA